MKRSGRLALTAFIVGLLMMVEPSPAYSSNQIVQDVITCADAQGQTRAFQVGWDPSNRYFEGKGDIARLFCEGGHAGAWTIFVSSTLAEDDPRRYYNGMTPTPEPTIEPTPSLEPTPEPEPTPLPSLTPEPTIEPTSTPVEPIQTEPTPEALATPTQLPPPPVVQEIPPLLTPQPTPEPTIEPTPTPTSTPIPDPSPTPIISAPEEVDPTPTPTDPQQVSIEISPSLAAIPGAIQLVAAAEAIMNIGADMTDEQREEAQAVVVSAIIVSQLAQVRKIK